MENTADALKMAFAIFVFIVALSMVFSLIGNIKETADAVLYYSDKTNYYQTETGTADVEKRKKGRNRYSNFNSKKLQKPISLCYYKWKRI